LERGCPSQGPAARKGDEPLSAKRTDILRNCAEPIVRVPALEIERAVAEAAEKHHRSIIPQQKSKVDQTGHFADVTRIEVREKKLAVWLKAPAEKQQKADADQAAIANRAPPLLIPRIKPLSKRFKEILLPAAIKRHQVRPIKFERRAALLKSIARGRAWLDEIVSGTASVEDIAVRQKCSVRHVNMTISMAFIAPSLVKAAIEGRLPRGIGVAALRDAPAEWSLQFERLGLAQI